MIFTPQGLMLGAGTILVPAEGFRKLKSLRGQEQQVLALLSAALTAGRLRLPFSPISNVPPSPGARGTTSLLTFI
jgi:hypothetical protein